MYFQYSMYNWYIPSFDFEHNDFSDTERVASHPQEQDVTAREARLHTPTVSNPALPSDSRHKQAAVLHGTCIPQYDHYRAFTASYYHERFPNHDRGEHDHAKVQHLVNCLGYRATQG